MLRHGPKLVERLQQYIRMRAGSGEDIGTIADSHIAASSGSISNSGSAAANKSKFVSTTWPRLNERQRYIITAALSKLGVGEEVTSILASKASTPGGMQGCDAGDRGRGLAPPGRDP